MNEELEVAEQRKKDELKQRKEATKQEQTQNGWECSGQEGVNSWVRIRQVWLTTSDRSTVQWHHISRVVLNVDTHSIKKIHHAHENLQQQANLTEQHYRLEFYSI